MRLFVSVEPSAEARAGAGVRPKSQTCFIDRSCVSTSDFPNVDAATRAVGQLTFVDGGSSYVCTGGLMNTSDGSAIPYLLTANHCFSSQDSATSLEAFWQYRTATCNGPFPDENLFPRTLGSTLLETDAPYLAPAPFRGKPNESSYLPRTAARLAEVKGVSVEAVARATTENFRRLFRVG